ncbi:hypothetical protein Tco_1030206 [Tanacetum coccineum]|uniref:Uncharacterized protein n=1 Tax=Tanacetum coccineum TaxID=301880 RepID=A0ABQ5G701_9ASTR
MELQSTYDPEATCEKCTLDNASILLTPVPEYGCHRIPSGITAKPCNSDTLSIHCLKLGIGCTDVVVAVVFWGWSSPRVLSPIHVKWSLVPVVTASMSKSSQATPVGYGQMSVMLQSLPASCGLLVASLKSQPDSYGQLPATVKSLPADPSLQNVMP